MAPHVSVEVLSLSFHHGIRYVTNAGESVEDVLLEVAECFCVLNGQSGGGFSQGLTTSESFD